jgi:endoglucanase
MRRLITICLLLIASLPVVDEVQGQTLQSGSVGGMPYQLLPASGGCTSTTPCSVVLYLSYMDETAASTAGDLQSYFGGAFAAQNPHTIVVAPTITQPQSTDVNWGGYAPGTTAQQQQAVAVVQALEQQYGGSVNPRDVVVTGGSLGGDGTQSMLIQYGPNGETGQHIFSAGLSFDAALYTDASNPATRVALCGVPLMAVHGTADTNQSVTYDQALASNLSGCSNFSLDLIQGAGHGTWGGSSGYAAGDGSGTPLAWLSAQLASGGSGESTGVAGTTTPTGVTASVSSAKSPTLSNAPESSSTPASSTGPAVPSAKAICTSLPGVQTLLPCGMFHTVRSQVIDQQNRPVRLVCAGWFGDLPNYDAQMLAMTVAGFNCVRVSYFNASIDQDLGVIDQTVAAAAKVGVRVIINNHANEGQGNCVSQQANGLWFDSGPGSNGTDGCGSTGTVTAAKFQSDWVRVAKHYAGNQTVIGFDLWNEPLEIPGDSQWGGGGPTDIRAMYQTVGSAVEAADPGALIICEGPIAWQPLYNADLSHVASMPVVLNAPDRVVYSVHLYPSDIGAEPFDSGPQYIQLLNQAFGYLITQDIAPVWIGEIGASMTSQDDQAWAATVAPYINGKASGGLIVPAGGQPPGVDWWAWSYDPGGSPVGMLQSDLKTLWPNQAAVFAQFAQSSIASEAAISTAAYAQSVAVVAASVFPTIATVSGTVQTGTAGHSLSGGLGTSPDAQATAPSPASTPANEQAALDAGQVDAAQVTQSGSQTVARQVQALQGSPAGATQ